MARSMMQLKTKVNSRSALQRELEKFIISTIKGDEMSKFIISDSVVHKIKIDIKENYVSELHQILMGSNHMEPVQLVLSDNLKTFFKFLLSEDKLMRYYTTHKFGKVLLPFFPVFLYEVCFIFSG